MPKEYWLLWPVDVLGGPFEEHAFAQFPVVRQAIASGFQREPSSKSGFSQRSGIVRDT